MANDQDLAGLPEDVREALQHLEYRAYRITDGEEEIAAIRAELLRLARDSARLDALEADIAAHGPIVLHNGEGCAAARRGLGLSNTGRTLRQALDQFAGFGHD